MKLFYTTNISVTLWIVNKNKKEKDGFRDRTNEILFLDLRHMGSPFEKKYIQLTQEDRNKVTSTINSWRKNLDIYENIPGYCYSAKLDEIRQKNYTLVPSRYIEFADDEFNLDFDVEIDRLSKELKELIKEESISTNILINLMEELNYEH